MSISRPPSKPYDLEITVISAKHLKNVNWRQGDLKPYAIFWVDPDRRVATKSDDSGSTRPVWNERFVLPLSIDPDETLFTLEIFHSKPLETPKPLVGILRFPLKKLTVDSDDSNRIRSFDLRRPSGRPHGKIRLKLAIRERPLPDYQFTPQSNYYYSTAPPPPPRDYSAFPPTPYSPSRPAPPHLSSQSDYPYPPSRPAPPPLSSSSDYPYPPPRPAPPPLSSPASRPTPSDYPYPPSRPAPPPLSLSAPRPTPSDYLYSTYSDPYSGYYQGYYSQPLPPPPPRPFFDRQSVSSGPSAPVDYTSYDQKPVKSQTGKMGMGTGLAVGAVAGALGGLALEEGLKYEEKITDTTERELAARDDYSDYRAEY